MRVALPVPGPKLDQRVTIFRNALDERDPLRYLQHAHALYTWLIQPLQADLAAWHIQTLVFVPDGALRLLPWAALYDGQQFLIEQYAVAITPSLTLTEEQPLELLTLSACETARGDDRAALGLAGVAIQAGARSALATLWLVADEAAAVLMETFYQRLQDPTVSRARALQQAQLTLLLHPQ